MNRAISHSILALLVLASSALCVEKDSSALTLLRGVEAARLKQDSLKARITLENLPPEPYRRMDCLVEMQGIRRRFEILPGEDAPGSVVIRDANEMRSFDREEHADVRVYDTGHGVRIQGDLAFDPRILGLSDSMDVEETVRKCLWYEGAAKTALVGKDQVKEVAVWRVRVTTDIGESDYWIEEPGFRVHRRTVSSPKLHTDIEITSEFDPKDGKTPFPNVVHVRRKGPRGLKERRFSLAQMEIAEGIPAERFTLKSMGLPVNTMISDYRTKQLVGYWNGEAVSPKPIEPAEQAAARDFQAPMSAGRRWTIILSGLAAIMLAALYFARRGRQGGRDARAGA